MINDSVTRDLEAKIEQTEEQPVQQEDKSVMWKPVYTRDKTGEEVFDGSIAYQPGNNFDEIINVENEQAAIRLCELLNERDNEIKKLSSKAPNSDSMNHYMREAAKTAVYPDAGECTAQSLGYLVLALCGEAGELANMYKKVLRGDKQLYDPAVIHQLVGELGGVLWYVSQIANELPGWTLKHVAQKNLDTLASRQQRGVIQGDGDER